MNLMLRKPSCFTNTSSTNLANIYIVFSANFGYMQEHDENTRRLLIGVAMILIIYIISVPFFMYLEGFTLVDGIYFVTVSITSAGYGDIVPKTTIGRLYASLLLLVGVSIFFYHVTHFGQFKEKAIDPHIQRRLQVLRNLTAMQAGKIEPAKLKKIKDKIVARGVGDDNRGHGFGRL